jgi:hypothetical protein
VTAPEGARLRTEKVRVKILASQLRVAADLLERGDWAEALAMIRNVLKNCIDLGGLTP